MSNDPIAYAFQYFSLHAGQRMSLFNFFLVLSGLVLSGLGGCIGNHALHPIGAFLGLILTVTALVFFKLDQRTSFLVKHAEDALKHLEAPLPEPARLFTAEQVASAKHPHVWTYGFCLRFTFAVFGGVGLIGGLYCALT